MKLIIYRITGVNSPWVIIESPRHSNVNTLWMRMMVVEEKMMMFTPSAVLENTRKTAAFCSPIRNSNFTNLLTHIEQIKISRQVNIPAWSISWNYVQITDYPRKCS